MRCNVRLLAPNQREIVGMSTSPIPLSTYLIPTKRISFVPCILPRGIRNKVRW
jgi:hypothetical protein